MPAPKAVKLFGRRQAIGPCAREDGETGMARRPGSGKTPRQAPGAASPGHGIDRQAKTPPLALPADLGRSLRLLDDAQIDRLAEAVADEVRRRGRSAPDSPSMAIGSVERASAKAARAKPNAPEKGRHGNSGTGTADPRRLRGRSQARRDREGVPGLAVDRAACYYRRATGAPQDGAIDGRGPQADIHAQEFDPARFRCDDRRWRSTGRLSARIEATPRVGAASPASNRTSRLNRQKQVLAESDVLANAE